MDIICAKCGKHLNSIEAAREHKCHAETSNSEPMRWLPPKYSKMNSEEWDKLIKLINNPSSTTNSKKLSAINSVEPTLTKEICPNCRKYLYYDLEKTIWICKGKDCKRIYTYYDLHKKEPQAEEQKSTLDNKRGEKTNKNIINKKTADYKIPKWLMAVLFIFAFSIFGWGISLIVGNNIPLSILLGFSFIYSIEKWFSHSTKKHKSIGKFYRFILNLAILSLLGLLIWSGIQLFSQQFFQSSIIGSLIFIAEFVFFIWMWKVIAKNSWRWPSMKFTIFSLIVLFFVFAYAGIQPIQSYKDTAFSYIGSVFENLRNNTTDTQEQTTNTIASSTTTPTATEIKIDGIDEETGIYKNYYLGLVKTPDGVSGGENCYGEFIVLINNKNAENPSYAELLTFLKSDKTDEFTYQYSFSIGEFYYGEAEDKIDLEYILKIINGMEQPANPKVCADFAERLHNNAEKAGIRCGYVIIDSLNHALNVFETTDKGFVYIDDTGTHLFGPSNCDKVVHVKEGIEYIPISLFHEYGWSDTWESLGIIGDIFITWDGEWR